MKCWCTFPFTIETNMICFYFMIFSGFLFCFSPPPATKRMSIICGRDELIEYHKLNFIGTYTNKKKEWVTTSLTNDWRQQRKKNLTQLNKRTARVKVDKETISLWIDFGMAQCRHHFTPIHSYECLLFFLCAANRYGDFHALNLDHEHI